MISTWTLHLVYLTAAGWFSSAQVAVSDIRDLGTLHRCQTLALQMVAEMTDHSAGQVKTYVTCVEINPAIDQAPVSAPSKGTQL